MEINKSIKLDCEDRFAASETDEGISVEINKSIKLDCEDRFAASETI